MKKITLYVDVVSPFAYLAFKILQRDAIFQQCQITYIPIFLGGIMHAAGNTPPVQIKNKDKWIDVEQARWSRYFGIPIVPKPPKFPAFTLTVMRTICALAHLTGEPQTSPAAQRAIVAATHAFYDAHWGQGRDITDPAVIQDGVRTLLPTDATEADVQRVLEVAATEGKRILLANTDAAFGEGAFGLPWMVCENDKGEKEGFWGVDHLGVMVDFLGLERPRNGSWKALL